MKQQLSPVAVAGIIAGVILVIAVGGFLMMKRGEEATFDNKPGNANNMGMPPDVAAEFQKRMGGANPSGATAPQMNNAAPRSPMGGGMTAPPMGGR